MSGQIGPYGPNQNAPGGKPFPDVNEDQIEAAGGKVSAAAESLVTARRQVQYAALSTAWTSPSARPAWDDALDARENDVKIGHAVLSDIGDAMVKAAGYLRELRATYNQATEYLETNPDPSISPQDATMQHGMLVVAPSKPDPKAVAEYETVKRLRANTATEARSVLDFLGTQFTNASAVTFATPPTTPVKAVTPAGLVVPIVPGLGAPTGALFANGVPIWLTRGNNFEKDVLRQLGLSGSPKMFYRPPDDENLPSDYPRTRILGMPRGTFPDSTKADVLEIKSGTTEIGGKDPQIRAELELSERTGKPLNLIVEQQTDVDRGLRDEIESRGGAIYEKIPGEPGIFRDRGTGDLVRLQGAQGPNHDQLGRTPLTPEETRHVHETLRSNYAPAQDTSPPAQTEPYVTQQQLDHAYADNPDAEPPAPGVAPEEPVGPAEPVDPDLPELPDIFEDVIP